LTDFCSVARASLKHFGDLTDLSPKSLSTTTFVVRNVATIRSPFGFSAVALSAVRQFATVAFASKWLVCATDLWLAVRSATALRQSRKASVKMAQSFSLSLATVVTGFPMTTGQWQRSRCCNTNGR